MKLASFSALGVLIAGSFLVTLMGCQTDTPGATNTLGSYSTMIDGPPDKVTAAAEKAAGDLKLADIVGMAIVAADLLGIDLERAMALKWLQKDV